MTELESLLRRVVGPDQGGFLNDADIADLQRLDRMRLVLIRAGFGRFRTEAQTVEHFREIVEKSGRDYIRDISLPAGDRAYAVEDPRRWQSVTGPEPSTRKPIIDPIPLPAGAPRDNWQTRGNSFEIEYSDADPGL